MRSLDQRLQLTVCGLGAHEVVQLELHAHTCKDVVRVAVLLCVEESSAAGGRRRVREMRVLCVLEERQTRLGTLGLKLLVKSLVDEGLEELEVVGQELVEESHILGEGDVQNGRRRTVPARARSVLGEHLRPEVLDEAEDSIRVVVALSG